MKASIREYGYQALIIVDENRTIIAGHTRYRALREMGWTEVDVIVSDMPPKKAQEYRVIDNRSAEIADWTDDLQIELMDFVNTDMRDLFFPTTTQDLNHTFDSISQDDIDRITEQVAAGMTRASEQREGEPRITIPCPYCQQVFTLKEDDVLKRVNWETDR